MSLRSLLLFFFSCIGLCRSFVVQAAGWFTIETYDVQLALASSGSMQVTETITVNFPEPTRGLIRKIPQIATIAGTIFRSSITDVIVDSDPFLLSTDGEYVILKIGDTNAFVMGRHTYRLMYTVYGWVRQFSGYSELYWNIVGDQWTVPIHQVHFLVTFPYSVPWIHESSATFARYGPRGAKHNTGITKELTDVFFSWSYWGWLSPYEAFSIGIKFPATVFTLDRSAQSLLLVPTDTTTSGNIPSNEIFISWYGLTSFNILSIVWLLILGFCLWGMRLYFVAKNTAGNDHRTIIPQYKPPTWISATEVGALIDATIQPTDITAMIYTWAAAWYIKIEATQWEEETMTHILHKIKQLPVTFPLYETSLFAHFFPATTTAYTLTKNVALADAVATSSDQLDAHVAAMWWYTIKSLKSKPLRYMLWCLVLVCLFLFLVCNFFVLGYTQSMSMPVSSWVLWAILGCTGYIFSWLFTIQSPVILSSIGRDLVWHIRGYQLFLSKVEEPQLISFLKKDPLYFDRTLPYAIVFGLQTEFLKKITPLLTKNTNLYQSSSGADMFALIATIHAIESTIAHTEQTTYNSTNGFSAGSSFDSSSSDSGGSSWGGSGGGGGDSR